MSLTADDLAAFAADTFPVSAPPVWETGKHALYVDVAALLDGDLADAPAPESLRRTDGIGLFYNGQVNLVFGDPESGKSWICLAAISEALSLGRRAVVIDLDHNGPSATVQRLLMLGAPEDALRDPEGPLADWSTPSPVGLARPRLPLQERHTTATSCSRMGLPLALRSHAMGRWSVVRSIVVPQSVQKGWSLRARSLSLAQV